MILMPPCTFLDRRQKTEDRQRGIKVQAGSPECGEPTLPITHCWPVVMKMKLCSSKSHSLWTDCTRGESLCCHTLFYNSSPSVIQISFFIFTPFLHILLSLSFSPSLSLSLPPSLSLSLSLSLPLSLSLLGAFVCLLHL